MNCSVQCTIIFLAQHSANVFHIFVGETKIVHRTISLQELMKLLSIRVQAGKCGRHIVPLTFQNPSLM